MEENERPTEEEEEEEEVWSWGAGTEGQLGTEKLEDEHFPQQLRVFPSLSSADSISLLACGGAHVISLSTRGRVLTWGRGTSGQLGHGEMVNSLQPKAVKSLESFVITHVSAGWSHSGFVSDSGCLFTCGDGSFGQLGHGDYQSHCSPIKVSCFGSKHVEQVACDHSGHQVYGFGSGKRGQLGISKDKIKSISLPQVTIGFEDVEIISISANGDHSAALSADGHLYTWGREFSGTSDAYYPHCLPSSLWFIQAALGWNHALLLTGDGEVFMLGGNHHGVLSDPQKLSPVKHLSEDSREVFLEKVPSLDDVKVVQIAAGAEHSALVTDDGVVKTWGWGEHGQLGLGNTCDQTSPQAVSLGHKPFNKHATSKVYCGSGFTIVIRTVCLPSQTSNIQVMSHWHLTSQIASVGIN